MKRTLLFQDADGNKIYSGDIVEWRKHYKQGEYWGDCKQKEPCYYMIEKFVSEQDGHYLFSIVAPWGWKLGRPVPILARDYELRKINIDRLEASEVKWFQQFKEEIGV